MSEKEGGSDANAKGAGGDEAPAKIEVTDEDLKLMETVPFDPRFPNQNQTKHCYSSFIDYHRCVKLRGEDYAPCQYYYKAFKALCPNFWIQHWTTQLEENRFPGPINLKSQNERIE